MKTIGEFDVEVSCQRINVNGAMKRSLGSQVHDKDISNLSPTYNKYNLTTLPRKKGILDPTMMCGRASAQDTITNYQND